MKAEIIRLLKECDGYLSGQELCELLGVSRTAVWKVIKQLQKEGYEIEAVRNRGYRLVEGGDVMTEAEIKSCMDRACGSWNIVCYDETDSTNTRAKHLAEEGAGEGTLVVAERQNAGKGRRGRSWVSPSGTGIWMSLVLRPDIPPSKASMLTLVAALGVCEGIYRAIQVKTDIKWPNDIVLNKKKICGILTEMSTELDSIQYVVVGVGINVNIEAFPEELSQTATSLYLETKEKYKRAPIIGAVAAAFWHYYKAFLETGDLSGLKEDYESRLANMGRQVTVMASPEAYGGICRGIDKEGELLVERENGEICHVLSGEVSVRGVYGYV